MLDWLGWDIWGNLNNVLGVAAVIAGVIYWLIHTDLQAEDSFFANHVQRDTPGKFYTNALRAVLDRLDRWLTPPGMLVPGNPAYRPPPSPHRAWNWKAYDRMLLLAVIYPFALPIVLWVLLLIPGGILGKFHLGDSDFGKRLEAGAWLALAAMLLMFNRSLARWLHFISIKHFVRLLQNLGWTRPHFHMVGKGLVRVLLLLAIATANTFVLAYTATIANSANSFAGAVPVIITLAIPVTVAITVTGSGAAAVVVALISSGMVADLAQNIAAGAQDHGGESFAIPAVIFANAVADALCNKFELLANCGDEIGRNLLIFSLMFIIFPIAAGFVTTRLLNTIRTAGASLAAIYFALTSIIAALLIWSSSSFNFDLNGASEIILFFGALPLSNAIFDFASLGLTRYCLRLSISPTALTSVPRWAKRPLVGSADFLLAIFLLWALCLTMLAAVVGLNAVSQNGDLLSLSGLIRQIDARNPALTWLYVTAVSTLVPSLVHVLIAWLSLVFAPIGPKWRGKIARALNDPKPGNQSRARVYVAAGLTVWAGVITLLVITFAAILLKQFHLLGGLHSGALTLLIDSVLGTADWLGLLDLSSVRSH